MGNKMLIDAAHPEETRVVVLRGNRIEEFDFEAASKRQLRGNIYLAKVTRVEPSLQAAFIEYGGNRHGFLAFSEIHPDYYQIPVADRQQLLEDEARSAEDDEEEAKPGNGHRRSRRHRRGGAGSAEKRNAGRDDAVATEDLPGALEDVAPAAETAEDNHPDDGSLGDIGESTVHETRDQAAPQDSGEPTAGDDAAVTAAAEPPAFPDGPGDQALDEIKAHEPDHVATLEDGEEASAEDEPDAHDIEPGGEADGENGGEEEAVEQLGGDALEDVPHRVSRPRRHYKIQEVIKRRQVLLVQVVKEERGNKGAALTTYLSLAGRYAVLMPNTARGGGISRKIVDPEDRKRLKAIAQELEVPDGMGIILRTAGASRGMPEVKRDFEYLMRMWETVRETTLQSSAPTLVYEEGSLIKRSIRDLFTKDVDEVVVAGDEGFKEAKAFMRLLMPNQLRNVIAYRDPQPLFAKSGVEAQLDAMFSNQVVLKSGGYLVINQTEALVAIDVNSGRSTREHNIEDTALRTNLEAADEIARQLRLRDLAGLIVVDFIDMEEGRNDRAVERRLKDALKNDRARIQIGRISHFGLLEMSRQRMRTGVLEGSTVMCAHCAGSGTVRSVSSMALHVLRLLEDALLRSAAYNLIARTRAEVALYILNQKRANLLGLESRFGVAITVLSDPAMTGMVYHAVERGGEATPPQAFAFRADAPAVEDAAEEEADEEIEGLDSEAADSAEDGIGSDEGAAPERRAPDGHRSALAEGEGGRRRRRRRRRRGRDGQPLPAHHDTAGGTAAGEGTLDLDADAAEDDEIEAQDDHAAAMPPETAESGAAQASTEAGAAVPTPVPDEDLLGAAAAAGTDEGAEAETAEPARRRRTRRPAKGAAAAETGAAGDDSAVEEPATPPRRARRGRSRGADLPLDLEAPTAPDDRPAGGLPEPEAAPAREPELPLTAAAPTAEAPVREEPEAEPPSLAAALTTPSAPAPAAPAAADPDRPKRSGWWQRAKATFTAGS